MLGYNGTANSNQTYLIGFSINNTENSTETDNTYTYTTFAEEEPAISLLIDRVWGKEQQLQIPKWGELLSQLNSSLGGQLSIRGDIVSVFVTDS